MQHPGIDTGSSGPCRSKKKHIAFVHVALMARTEVSRSLGILTSEGNPASYVQAGGNGNMSSILTG